MGIHYVGDMHNDQKLMPRLFQHITKGKLLWEDMREVYDKIVFEDNLIFLKKHLVYFE